MGLVYRLFASDVAAYLQMTNTKPYRVLDVASATGEPAFTLVKEVADVNVTVTDISEVCFARSCTCTCTELPAGVVIS